MGMKGRFAENVPGDASPGKKILAGISSQISCSALLCFLPFSL